MISYLWCTFLDNVAIPFITLKDIGNDESSLVDSNDKCCFTDLRSTLNILIILLLIDNSI